MAAYETDISRSYGSVAGPGVGTTLIWKKVSLALATAMLDNANDDVGLFYVPKGCIPMQVMMSLTDVDTNGSPALVVDVGDAADEDRIVAATTIGQASGVLNDMALAGFMYKYTAQTQLRAFIKTAAGTAATGTLNFALGYLVDEEYSTTALTPA